jgi:hypothetical protein
MRCIFILAFVGLASGVSAQQAPRLKLSKPACSTVCEQASLEELTGEAKDLFKRCIAASLCVRWAPPMARTPVPLRSIGFGYVPGRHVALGYPYYAYEYRYGPYVGRSMRWHYGYYGYGGLVTRRSPAFYYYHHHHHKYRYYRHPKCHE